MLTQATFQLPAGGTIAVDTKQTALPIAVQSGLDAASHGAPYLKNGAVFVDFTSRASSPMTLTVVFAKQWQHFL